MPSHKRKRSKESAPLRVVNYQAYTSLVKLATSSKSKAYAPYSKFRVGAALLTTSGKVFTGCNIENSSYSLTICAERTALFKAISEGYTSFSALAIASDAKEFVPPCGACRQVIMELAPKADILLSDSKNNIRFMKVDELLPLPFKSELLPKK